MHFDFALDNDPWSMKGISVADAATVNSNILVRYRTAVCDKAGATCALKAPGQWDGWATTTHFGSGEAVWPDASGEVLADINNLNNCTVGAAVPWRIYCKEFGSRQALLDAYHATWMAKDTPKETKYVCYQIQPIKVLPAQIQEGSYDWPGSGTAAPHSINDAEIGLDVPIMTVVSYEGCGGNCNWPPGSGDCFNSCGISTGAATECDFSQTTDPTCATMKKLFADGKWTAGEDMYKDVTNSDTTSPSWYVNHSCPTPFAYGTNKVNPVPT